MTRFRMGWVTAAAAALLAACGGGGDTAATPVGPYMINAALQHLLLTGGSWPMSGSDNGTTVTVTIAFAPAASGPYPVDGTASSQAVETITIASSGTSSSGTQTIYFNATADAFIGLQSSGLCSTATSNTALPASAVVGAAGPIFTENDLDGCASNSNVVSTSSNTWTVVADTGIALLCWNVAETALTPAGASGTESTCIEVAPDGTLGANARFSLTSGTTVNISARNF
jgi:hypothetical protein